MGACQCPTAQTACAGACTPLNTDNKNCGKCGTVCAAGTTCLFGGCLDPSSLACSPSAQAGKTSTKDASILIGKYWVNNNQWGSDNGSGSQAIWSTCQQGEPGRVGDELELDRPGQRREDVRQHRVRVAVGMEGVEHRAAGAALVGEEGQLWLGFPP